MKTILATLAAAAVSVSAEGESWNKELTLPELHSLDLRSTFDDWKESFNRVYDDIEDESFRFSIWSHNMDLIARHNSDPHVSWKQRMNQFGDLTKEEFRSKMLGYRNIVKKPKGIRDLHLGRHHKHGKQTTMKKSVNVPDSIDWTDMNGTSYVTPIKNQGDCGSCWAFSTTGSLECRGAIATGTLNSLSEQQLVDCSDAEGNEGCDGGLMDDAFEYVKKEGGLCSEEEYPYKARDGVCEADSCGTKYNKISNYNDVTSDDSDALEDNVANGCVSVAVDASDWSFYSSGVYCRACGDVLDHGVLAVGYGTDNRGTEDTADDSEYWKIKNSWGRTWGMDGYILLCRNNDEKMGECGVLRQPSYPDPDTDTGSSSISNIVSDVKIVHN